MRTGLFGIFDLTTGEWLVTGEVSYDWVKDISFFKNWVLLRIEFH